jgi:predicted ATPase
MYGKNGRGKSSVAQALLLIGQSMKRNNNIDRLLVNDSFVSLGQFDELVNINAKEKSFEITLISNNKETVTLHFSKSPKSPDSGILTDMTVNEQSRVEKMSSFAGNGDHDSHEPKDNYTFNDNLLQDFHEPTATYRTFLSTSDVNVLQELKETLYVAADRKGPVSTVKSSFPYEGLDPHGGNVINIIASRDVVFLQEVEKALSYTLSGASIQINSKDAETLELKMNSADDDRYFHPVNVGFGYSYVLPVIVAALLAKENSLLIIENPEAHLHPGAQSRVIEFLIRQSNKKNLQLLIESHSDHVINGLRIAVKKGILKPEDALINHFDYKEGKGTESEIKKITCDKNGTLSDYPNDFMDEWTAQMMQLV